jgi:hypothetical protein
VSADATARTVFAASARHRAHGIVSAEDARAALDFVRQLSAILESGYRLTFVDRSTRGPIR